MRHLEPEPLAQRKDESRARGALRPWISAAMLVVFAGAGGYGATHLFPPSDADDVSAAEVKSRADDFARAQPLKLEAVPLERRAMAIMQMGLSQADSDAMATLVSAPAALPGPNSPQPQRLGLVELVLWDTHAPDGDVVLVTSAGYSREVLLAKTPTVIHVPGAGAGTIQITGVRDGGGGITLGVKGAGGSLLMPIMSVGQTLALPVQFP